MAKFFGVIIDEKRLAAIKGTPIEEKVEPIFGGALKRVVIEVPDELGQKVIEQFSKARFDARGFIEETPAAFKRLVFKKILELKALTPEVLEKAIADVASIKDEVAKEDKELPIPDVDISDVLELQKNPVQKPA
ncbi:MAG TPA: hypothetical protein PKZ17_00955 [Thermodesulfovibrio thiophilus]|uniref:DUF6955 family protein n=1 Tax=Thermodesulfovibrio thiophilus TaxID=340095 RepID=UPI0004019BFD|nr:hypothetical protein [Thermodesulfovibrio thiophilus]HHW20588.1 hypothetical protein [Thermodesulfovibrio thiophilus]HOA83085.1 hypothetical protein [Thermodesulfovibrio thiophilus]HQA03285.1 hypothetical protein [Thermodesulfovibrio thiophilus]HQD36137.1 hypothetical protein [Thermodesulfovibrio thiophilus]